MSPPSYSDLGKSARDLFSKGYNFGFLKLESTTRTDGGLECKTGASQNTATGKMFGNIEFKYKIPDYGVTIVEKWNTDSTLGSEVTVEDKLVKGLKLTFESQYAPQKGNSRTGKVKGEFNHESVKVNADVSLDPAGPLLNLAGVFGYEGWLIGYQTGYDTQKSKMTHSNIGFGRKIGNYSLHTFVNDGAEFGANLWHSVNEKFEYGANVGWVSGEQTNRFGLAGKYNFDRDTVFRGKVSNNSQVALAMTHNLNSNLKLTLSSLVNLPNFAEGGHKFGMGLEYDSK